MKILVTGGAGFIGSHIVDTYIKQGHEVLIVDNLSTGKSENINPQAKLAEIDINDDALIDTLQKFKPEIVNHHAAQIDVRKSVDDPSFDAQVNIVGSLKLLEAVKHIGGVKKVIFASSGGAAYGDTEESPTKETVIARPISPYGVAKVSVEMYLHYYHQVSGLPYTALRYSNVYGPRQNPHGEAGVVAICFQRLLSGQTFKINGTGEQSRDFVFVTDVAKANMLATESDFVGIINIATSKQTSVNDLVSQICSSINFDQEIEHGPGKLGEQMSSCLDYTKASAELSWQPEVDLSSGISKTAEYFKAQI